MPTNRGHDARVARDLGMIWNLLRLRYPGSVTAAITGDLTKSGKGSQFGKAHRFIHSHWRNHDGTISLGLNADGQTAFTIPGNHDFWNGYILGSGGIFKRILVPHFWSLPWIHTLQSKDGKFGVVLIGLDSNSGFSSLGVKHIGARGAFPKNHLSRASELLSRQTQFSFPVLKIVMLHHPPHSLVSRCREDFQKWAQKENVQVILTGHVHKRDYPKAKKPERQNYFEFRCGTTLQRGTRNLLPGHEPNHFFLHNLKWNNRDSRIVWCTREYWHHGIQWTLDKVEEDGTENVHRRARVLWQHEFAT